MKSFWGLMMALMALSAQAQEVGHKPSKLEYSYQHNFQFITNFGIQNGGEVIHRLVWVDTGETADQMRAGGFWRGEMGVQIPVAKLPFSVDVTGGVLYGETKSNINDSKSNFKRKLVTAIPFFHFDRYRLGVGVTQHIDPTFTIVPDGGGRFVLDFDDATGAVLQFDVRYDQNIMVGFRFTNITYESNDSDLDLIEQFGTAEEVSAAQALREVNGNSFGIHVIGSF